MHRLVAAAVALVCCAQLFAPRAAAQGPAPAAKAANAAGAELDLEVLSLRNDRGQVGCSLFNDPKAFPSDDSKLVRHVWAPIHGRKAMCKFAGLAAGRYAAVVFHDENANGKFDENWLGMPLEGYGFSRDAAALLRPPSFDSAAFDYDGHRFYTTVNMRYWLVP